MTNETRPGGDQGTGVTVARAAVAAKSAACCGPAEQESCCAPAAKSACCGSTQGQGGCGCR